MTPRSIIDSEPSIATDIVVCGPRIAGAYAHRRVTKDVIIGERRIAAHKSGNIEFPERMEPIKQYLEAIAACVDTKGTAMSWGFAQANGAHLCPDCWEDGFGNVWDGELPAGGFELEAQPVAEDGTLIEPMPVLDELPAPSEIATQTLEEAERGYVDETVVQQQLPGDVEEFSESSALWDDEWGPQEPPEDDDWMPPTPPAGATWDHYGGPVHRGRKVERGPELP